MRLNTFIVCINIRKQACSSSVRLCQSSDDGEIVVGTFVFDTYDSTLTQVQSKYRAASRPLLISYAFNVIILSSSSRSTLIIYNVKLASKVTSRGFSCSYIRQRLNVWHKSIPLIRIECPHVMFEDCCDIRVEIYELIGKMCATNTSHMWFHIVVCN